MANPTFTLIASNTVGSGGASSVTFLSIPATYTDLLVKTSIRGSGSGTPDFSGISINGSTSNFNFRYIQGNGSGASSGSYSAAVNPPMDTSTFTANTFDNTEWYIPNYTSSNFKSISIDNSTENNSTTSYLSLYAALWSNTAAINSITFTPSSGNYVQYSTFSLYGINNS
jgi:hypothetical protein